MAVEPVDPGAPSATPEPEPEQSLAEHEAEFGGGAKRPEPDPEPEPDEDPRRPPRDTKTGQFKPQPTRHRAKSQEAGAADVPRIAELTRRLRETEAERDALKARPPAPPVAEPVSKPPAISPAPAATEKPKIEQFQEYSDYVEALADWKIAEARTADRAARQQETERTQLVESWRMRTDAARIKYKDFEQVALLAPTTIPQGSLVDAWILEDVDGADVLYELQRDEQTGGHLLNDILVLPSAIRQAKALSLLAQRLSGSTREPAVPTGAAATPVQKAAPRPPTPVRTSAVPALDEPPGEDASLAAHEKFYHRER